MGECLRKIPQVTPYLWIEFLSIKAEGRGDPEQPFHQVTGTLHLSNEPERMRRVGVLMGYAETDLAAQAQVAAFRQELQKLGWDEGRNIYIDVRFPAANADRVRANLRELTSLAPDVLVSNTDLVTAVVRGEVRTIPIVFISVGDAVGSGYVNNEARPDAKATFGAICKARI